MQEETEITESVLEKEICENCRNFWIKAVTGLGFCSSMYKGVKKEDYCLHFAGSWLFLHYNYDYIRGTATPVSTEKKKKGKSP